MRSSVIGFCVVLCFAGCASKTPGRAVGGTLTGLGAFAMITTYTASDPDQLDKIGAWSLLVNGAVVLLFNEARSLKDVETTEPRVEHIAGAETVATPATEDPRLRRLTLQASFAARRGQCTAVKAIADRVDEIDAAYRRGGFVTDASIVACL